jgi:hypothetical protein
MDLSDEQRKELEIIRYGYDSFLQGPVDGERRPATKSKYRQRQRTLNAFTKAWRELDEEVEWDVVCGLRALWGEEVESQPFNPNGKIRPPDAGRVVERLLDEMKKPNGSPEDYPGFGEATLLLWTAYCKDRPPWVKIDDEACAEIGEIVAGIFGLDRDTAHIRVKNWLNEHDELDENDEPKLPGRKRPPKSRPFP